MFMTGINLYKSFYSSAGKARQCRADVACSSRSPEISLGQKI